MRTVKAAAVYSALVFAAGFVLGTIRTLWIVPRVGMRTAELLETPFMILMSLVAARWTIRRFGIPATTSVRLGMGGSALGLMLVAEFGFVMWLRGLSIREYLAARDPVSGTVYCMALLVFALMPLMVKRT